MIGVYEQRWSAPAGPLCVYLHGVRDPGNVGTMLRSAHAFGASCVALGPGCADPHSTEGGAREHGRDLHRPARPRQRRWSELPGERIALSAGAREELHGPARQIAPALTLLVGAEREGLPPEVLAACERQARIPIAGESLNAAMAATVALYELTRQTI